MASSSCRKHGRLLQNFRDGIYIFQDDSSLTVELSGSISENIHIHANMGVSLALCHILCRENIFLLHAASVARRNHGYIFPGQSGSGKTTISRLSDENNLVLCDELTAIAAGCNESDNSSVKEYNIFPGPRWAQFTFNPEYYNDSIWGEEPHSVFPLKAILFPCQSDLREETHLRRVDSIDAAVELIMRFTDTSFVKSLPAESHRLAFHFFSELVRTVPCYSIHANLQTDIWKAIDEAVGE